MTQPLAAILVLVIVIGAVVLIRDKNEDASTTDAATELAQASSGVGADLVVHTAILDGATGGSVAEATDAKLQGGTATRAASILSVASSQPPIARPLFLGQCTEAPSVTNTGPTTLSVPRATVSFHVNRPADVDCAGRATSAIIMRQTVATRVGTLSVNNEGTGGGNTAPVTYTNQWAYVTTVFANGNGDVVASFETAYNDRAFLRFIRDGIPVDGPILVAPGSSTTTTQPPPTPTIGSVTIPITIDGDIITKNITSQVTVSATVTLRDALGGSNTIPLSGSTPASGGRVTLSGSFANVPIRQVQGDNTLTIVVTVRATDVGGAERTDTQTATITKKVDAAGSVHVTIRPGTIVRSMGAPDGSTLTRRHDLLASLVG